MVSKTAVSEIGTAGEVACSEIGIAGEAASAEIGKVGEFAIAEIDSFLEIVNEPNCRENESPEVV